MLLLTIKLICLDSVEVGDQFTIIYFNQGQSYQIESGIKNYKYATTLIQRSFQRQHPIGVSVDGNNKVIEVLRADSDFIKDINEVEDSKIEVIFQGHDGKYYLDTQLIHPNTIKEINKAIYSKERVWFVTAAPGLTVYDLLRETEIKKAKKKRFWE